MSHSKRLIGCWLGLAVLSLSTVLLGAAGTSVLLSAGVLLVALGKAWLIIDGFMEMRRAPRLWRGLLLGWPLAMVAGVLLALQFSS